MAEYKVGLNLVKKHTKEYSAKEIKDWFFNGTRKSKELIVTDEVVGIINATISDPEFDGYKFKDVLIEYQDTLLNKQNVNLEVYVNAIKFCSYMETSGGNVTESYIKTFRSREVVQKALRALEADPEKGYETQEYKNLYAAASRYRKTDMVKNILVQSEMPLYLMYQGYRYKIVEKLYEEAMTAKASRDRINACNVFLTHVRPPEGFQVEVNIKSKGNDEVSQIEEMLKNMAKKQQELIGLGVSSEEVANAKDSFIEAELIDGEV